MYLVSVKRSCVVDATNKWIVKNKCEFWEILTYYAEMSHPGFSLCSIDLTHVSSRI